MKDYTKKTQNVLSNWTQDRLLQFPDELARSLFFDLLLDMQETAFMHGVKAEKKHRSQSAETRYHRRQNDEV